VCVTCKRIYIYTYVTAYKITIISNFHPASSPIGTGVSVPGGKTAWGEADHSHPPSAEVKNGGTMNPLPRMSSWLSAQLITHRDNFTFCLLLKRKKISRLLYKYILVKISGFFCSQVGRLINIIFNLIIIVPTILISFHKNVLRIFSVITYRYYFYLQICLVICCTQQNTFLFHKIFLQLWFLNKLH
jgi:hypothetical protein